MPEIAAPRSAGSVYTYRRLRLNPQALHRRGSRSTLDVETPSRSLSEVAKRELVTKRGAPSAIGWTILFFVASWAAFYGLSRALPYLKNGSDVVFDAKLRWEEKGKVFPADPAVIRVLIFGNSKMLAGFLPSRFDQMSSANHLNIESFNSGFPGSDLFLPPLKAMCERGQAPHVLLLTLPWSDDPPRRGIFHFIPDDHAVIDDLFPFRNFLRDLTAFLLSAPSPRRGRELLPRVGRKRARRHCRAWLPSHHRTEPFPGGPPARRFSSRIRPADAGEHACCACPKHANS